MAGELSALNAPTLMIVCITGMPGAGKTTATQALAETGFQPVSMGDVVRKEAQRRGLDLGKEGQKKMMLRLRREGGPAAVAKLCGKEIKRRGFTRVVVDGARSLEEIEYFRTIGPVKILGIHASPRRRFELLSARGRKDDPMSFEDFAARDKRELALGLGEVIAMSDRMIENERVTIEELDARVKQVAKEWLSGT